MARRTKEEAAETRSKILSAALDVFSRKGFSRTTFVDIANQIDLTKGAVYWHFKTKSDLLVALIEEMVERKQQLVPPPETIETVAALKAHYLESVRTMFSDPELRKFEFFINYQIEWSEELRAEVHARLDKLGRTPCRKYTSTLSRLQECGAISASHDPDKLGTLLIATLIGLVRLVMMDLISEGELVARAEYSFDNIFRDIEK